MFYLFEWVTGDIMKLRETAHTITLNPVQESMTLPAERARLFDGTYESIVGAQSKAMEFVLSFPGAPPQCEAVSMEEIVYPDAVDGNLGNQFDGADWVP